MGLDSKYNIVMTDSAEYDYLDILENIATISLFTRSVEKWADLIAKKIVSLKIMPEQYIVFRKEKHEYRSARVGKYVIIYYINKKNLEVRIVRIVYARRDLEKVGLE